MRLAARRSDELRELGGIASAGVGSCENPYMYSAPARMSRMRAAMVKREIQCPFGGTSGRVSTFPSSRTLCIASTRISSRVKVSAGWSTGEDS